MKNIVLGILAHVDAGKTTLSEAMLYESGATDRLGRVDRGNAYLDTHCIERARGITVFSKQAVFDTGDTHITLIDTPGHIDFSAEAERALSILDYAVLVVSATDGVTAHTRTLWNMLRERKIPTFIFVNKTDLSDRTTRELCDEVRVALSSRAVSLQNEDTPDFPESVAGCDERLIEEYLATDSLSAESICEAIWRGGIFPCFFGSALKLKGVRELLRGIDKYTRAKDCSRTLFGARIYKISRDKSGNRLCFARITGGSLLPKSTVDIRTRNGIVTEKVEQIRVFSAERSTPVKEAVPGTVVALYGLSHARAGMGIGFEEDDVTTLTPPLCYRMKLEDGASPYEIYLRLAEIAEEEPSLSLSFNSESGEIRVNLMGEIQLEVLKEIIKERLGINVEFDEGSVLYRETVADTVRGAGHFEPLGHYAEVHLEIEPLPEGSGVIADTVCDTDTLKLNWQRLIMTHIEERAHVGRLTGAPLTDVRITLIAGKAHEKHTSGGDFREATYRAIRQAVMKSDAVLLEPTFDFRIDLPAESLGRLLTDITNMKGEATRTDTDGEWATVEGVCPVLTMRSYPSALRAYTKGYGRITMTPGAYAPAHNSDEIIAKKGYNPELDERNPAGSVFCKAGAGYSVDWREADEKMHIHPDGQDGGDSGDSGVPTRAARVRYYGTADEDKELMRIFEATYGKIKRREVRERVENSAENSAPRPKRRNVRSKGDDYLIIDGYNVIFAWSDKAFADEIELSLARDSLIREMCSYAAFRRCRVIIVFDAYKVKDGRGSIERYGAVTVVYTKERQTADAYIERATYEIAKASCVRVVTSDMSEQFIILGNGALRVSPRELRTELDALSVEIKDSSTAKK